MRLTGGSRDTDIELGGATVAITGAGRGIGKATARAFLDRGAKVAIGDLDLAVAKAAATELGTGRGDSVAAVGFGMDVADPVAFEAFLDEVEGQLGPVNILVNNAGIMPIGPFLGQDAAQARRTVDVNLHGVLNGVRAVLPRMLRHGGGHIVNIASTAGKVATPGGVLYAATKHAVVGLSDGIRLEFGPKGIRVTTVLPSFTNTELISGTKGLRGVPTVEPEDVARAVVNAIDRRRTTVYVPRFLRASMWLHGLLPARVNDAILKLYRADTVFLDIDAEQRKAYDHRILEPGQ